MHEMQFATRVACVDLLRDPFRASDYVRVHSVDCALIAQDLSWQVIAPGILYTQTRDVTIQRDITGTLFGTPSEPAWGCVIIGTRSHVVVEVEAQALAYLHALDAIQRRDREISNLEQEGV